jgi:tetratricopeptide (TPR) repeat protein
MTIPNVMAAIHDANPSEEESGSSQSMSGILGLNFLNRFTMTVDSGRHTLVFEAIHPPSLYEGRNCAEAREWLIKGRQPGIVASQEIDYYQKAIRLCDDLAEAYGHLADAYYRQERYRDAIDQYLALVKLLPDEPNVHYQLGVLYATDKQYFQARRAFQKTLDLDPDHAEARESLEMVTP